MSGMIETVDLTKRYGNLHALRTVSVKVIPGAVTVLLGPNAAGKTTLMEILIGMRKPTTGSVTVAGCDPWTEPRPEWRKRVGYLPQEVIPIDYLSGTEYVQLMGDLYGMPRGEVNRALPEALSFFDLRDGAKRRLGTLSTGSRKKTVLCALRVCRPDILILDEPFEGLDPHAIRRLQGWLTQEAERGTTVLLSSHVISLVAPLAQTLIVIADGSIRYMGGNPEREAVLLGSERYADMEELYFAVTGGSDHAREHCLN